MNTYTTLLHGRETIVIPIGQYMNTYINYCTAAAEPFCSFIYMLLSHFIVRLLFGIFIKTKYIIFADKSSSH